MKSKIKMAGMLLAMVLFPVIFPKQASAQQPYVSFQVFYDQLNPYGQWVDYSNYGYVWMPDAGPGFFPYSSQGHWIMTEYGWTWLSDYDWGWAPFHYGRWDYDNYYGWFWVPDNIWGPAWVTWRRAQGYYGWAPMGPGMSIGTSFGGDYNGYNNHWIFMEDRYFGRNNINRYYASQNEYDMLFRNSTVINNTYVDNRRQTTYVSGPDKADVQRVTRRRITSYDIQENNAPGQYLRNGQLSIYRPQVIKNNDSEQSSSPSRITNLQDVRRPSERVTPYQQGEINRSVNTRREQQQGAVNRQNAEIQQNAVDRKNAVDQQNAVDRQNVIDEQNAVNRQNAVDQLNTLNRKNAVNRQDAVNRQNAEDQQDAVNQQKTVNQQNTADRQNAVKRQNAVNQQNIRNNERVLQQQNVKRTNNERREPPVNIARPSKNIRSEEPKNPNLNRNIRK